MNQGQNPIANDSVVFREEFDDWAILFDPESNDAFGLNPVSVVIWKCLDGKHSTEDIVNTVCNSCKNTPARPEVEADIKQFITELIDAGFAGYAPI